MKGIFTAGIFKSMDVKVVPLSFNTSFHTSLSGNSSIQIMHLPERPVLRNTAEPIAAPIPIPNSTSSTQQKPQIQSKIMLSKAPPSLFRKKEQKSTDSPAPNILKRSTFQQQSQQKQTQSAWKQLQSQLRKTFNALINLGSNPPINKTMQIQKQSSNFKLSLD